jgi:serine/threonine protein phosphatase 1
MNRRIVITDIHGCFYSFKNLLEEKVKLQKKDRLYLLGDYINKGPHSKEVLDYLMCLQQGGHQLHMLRGNHEQELLNLLDGKSDLDRLMSKGAQTLLKSFGVEQPQQIPLVYIDFIRSMEYFFELPDFYLVHAGFDFSKQNPFTASETLLNIRSYTVDLNKTQNRRVIHGHTPTNLTQILQSLEAKSSLHYSLDAGCAYKDNQQQAHLIALDLDSWQVMCQPNIDPSANYA